MVALRLHLSGKFELNNVASKLKTRSVLLSKAIRLKKGRPVFKGYELKKNDQTMAFEHP